MAQGNTKEEIGEAARVVEPNSVIQPIATTAGLPGVTPTPVSPGIALRGRLRRSPAIGQLAGAMAAAQGEIEGAAKGKINPHFKNAYADLASVWDACRDALSKNGIAVFQSPSADGPKVTVTTLLAHKSGEWLEDDLTMLAQQNTPQAVGSCVTYARRYALAAMVGVAPEDDDGNAASQGNGKPQAVARPTAPEGYDAWLAVLEATADEGTAALESAWKKSQPYFRKHLTDNGNGKWDAIKKRAARANEAVPA